MGNAARDKREFRAPNPSESGERMVGRFDDEDGETLVANRDRTMAAPEGYAAFAVAPQSRGVKMPSAPPPPRPLSHEDVTPTPAVRVQRKSLPATGEVEGKLRLDGTREPTASQPPLAPTPRASQPVLPPPRASYPSRPPSADMTCVRPPSPSGASFAPYQTPPPPQLTQVRTIETVKSFKPTPISTPTPSGRASVPSPGEINRQVRGRERRTAWIWGGAIVAMLGVGGVVVALLARDASHASITPAVSAPTALVGSIAAAAPQQVKPAAPAAVTPPPVVAAPTPAPAGTQQTTSPENKLTKRHSRGESAPRVERPATFTPPPPPPAFEARTTRTAPASVAPTPAPRGRDTNSTALDLAREQLDAKL